MDISPSTIFKFISVVNKFKKAFDIKDIESLESYIDSMFKDAPEELKKKMREVIRRAQKYAEEGKKVDLLDIAEDLLSVFELSESEKKEAAKSLVDIAEMIAEEISNKMEKESEE